MVDIIADKDAWLAQLVGGTAKYGNGTGSLITIGPAPNETTGSPDFKGRGLWQFPLTSIAAFTTVSDAELELTVAPNTCLDERGDTIRILFELCQADFNEADEGTANPCQLGSGTGLGRWPGPGVTTANRALYSSDAGHATGDKITVDVTDMVAAVHAAGPPASGTWVIRIRGIAANADGSDYAETVTARKITTYSRETALAANQPVLRVLGASGSTAKTFTETAVGTDDFVVAATSGDQTAADTAVVGDEFSITQAPSVYTDLLDEDNGVGIIGLPTEDGEVHAYLDSVEAQDLVVTCRFRLDKVPSSGSTEWWLLLRYIDANNYYRLAININNARRMQLLLVVVASGVETTMATLTDARTLLTDTEYVCQYRALDVSPTSLLARLWRTGELVPGWVVGASNSSGPQGGGTVGLGARVTNVENAPITFTFDEFTAEAI